MPRDTIIALLSKNSASQIQCKLRNALQNLSTLKRVKTRSRNFAKNQISVDTVNEFLRYNIGFNIKPFVRIPSS